MRASNVSEQRFRRERVSSKRQFSCPFPFFFLPPLCLGALCVCRWPNKKGKQSRGSIPLCCSYAVLIPLFLYIYFFSGVLSTALEEPVLTNLLFFCVCFLTSKPEALPTSRQWNGNHTTDVASFRMMSPFFIIIFAVVAAFFFLYFIIADSLSSYLALLPLNFLHLYSVEYQWLRAALIFHPRPAWRGCHNACTTALSLYYLSSSTVGNTIIKIGEKKKVCHLLRAETAFFFFFSLPPSTAPLTMYFTPLTFRVRRLTVTHVFRFRFHFRFFFFFNTVLVLKRNTVSKCREVEDSRERALQSTEVVQQDQD